LRIADVELEEARLRMQVLALAGDEVVDDEHLVTPRQVQLDHVRADEARPAGHDDLHTRPLKNSIVFLRPASRSTFGSQPRIARARPISGWRTLGSSSGSGRKTISLRDPVSALMRSANCRIVTSTGLPR